MSKLEAITKQFERAVKRLDDVLKQKKDEFMRDSAIQRFEFTFDISWKAVKTYLEEKHGVACASPKKCFQEAYRQGLIGKDDFWATLTDVRNETAHTYNEETAERIYALLPQALVRFKELLGKLSK